MIRITHVTDDPAMGGVNRTLDAILPRLAGEFRHTRRSVTPARGQAPRLDADIIAVHFTVAWSKLLWLLSLRLRNPGAALLLVEHSYTRCFEKLHVRRRWRFRLMLRLSYALMDHIVAVSAAQAAYLAEAARLPAAKLDAINPFTDLALLRGITAPERHSGRLRLAAYGRYTSQKGFDVLIEAMREIPPELAELRVAGIGPDEAMLRRMAHELPHVRIDGPVDGPADLLAGCDAVVIPSRFEAFGNVALESRAAGRPAIVTEVDGLTEQAASTQALIVPPENPSALAGAIRALAGSDLTALSQTVRRSADGAEARTISAWTTLYRRLGAPAAKRRRPVRLSPASRL